jgi:uncharacterized protein YoxC
MNTLLLIILVVAGLAGIVWVLTKYFNLFADVDEDGIPDEVEEKVETAKKTVKRTTKEVKRRANRVKEELNDIKVSAKDLANQVGDVGKAIKGKPRSGRKKNTRK